MAEDEEPEISRAAELTSFPHAIRAKIEPTRFWSPMTSYRSNHATAKLVPKKGAGEKPIFGLHRYQGRCPTMKCVSLRKQREPSLLGHIVLRTAALAASARSGSSRDAVTAARASHADSKSSNVNSTVSVSTCTFSPAPTSCATNDAGSPSAPGPTPGPEARAQSCRRSAGVVQYPPAPAPPTRLQP